MKNFKKLFVIILVATLIFTLGACGNKEKETTTVADTTVISDTTVVTGTTVAAETTIAQDTTAVADTTVINETTIAAETTTVIAAVTTVKASTTKTPATKPATTKPTSIADIVSYYNLASNKAKKDKPGFTLVTTNIIGKITSSSGFIQSVAGTVVGMFNTKPATSTVAKGNNGDLPVQGQSYGSKLLPGSLMSATCVDKGATYEITLNFKDEKLSALPTDPTKTNHGQALNVLSASDISVQTDKFKAIVKVQQFAPTYTGSYIKCTVDKTTGNLKTATYYLNTQASVKAKLGFSVLDAAVPFGIKNAYTLNY